MRVGSVHAMAGKCSVCVQWWWQACAGVCVVEGEGGSVGKQAKTERRSRSTGERQAGVW